MKPKKLNPGLLWMQFEDVLAPRLGLSVKERAVYSYLLRHSLVVGKLRLQFAVMALARTLGLSIGAARQAVRRLDAFHVRKNIYYENLILVSLVLFSNFLANVRSQANKSASDYLLEDWPQRGVS